MSYKIIFKTVGIIFLTTTSACVTTKVGGTVSYKDDEGRVTESYLADCLGQCSKISPDGKCVQFHTDVSQVCLNYLSKAKLLKPVQGDNSVFIGGNATSGGNINIK